MFLLIFLQFKSQEDHKKVVRNFVNTSPLVQCYKTVYDRNL